MKRLLRHSCAVAAFAIGLPFLAMGQTDEIQVYDASIADQGKFNLTWHNNYTPIGRDTPDFPGGIIPDKSFNGVPEWAYGVTPWYESGLYLPVYSISRGRGLTYDGFKLRSLFVSPHAADRTFFYGINFEYSINKKYWESSHFSGEMRPILGWHLHPVDIIINPILDTDFNGLRNLDFAPESRVAYNFNKTWAAAVEAYDDFGPLSHMPALDKDFHEIFGVVDFSGKNLNVEFGAGIGLTSASDPLTFKLILSRDLN